MISILKKDAPKQEVAELCKSIEAQNIKINEVIGAHTTILGLIGDTHKIDMEAIEAQEIVESVQRVQEPYKGVNRKFHPEDTVVDVGGVKIGDGNVAVIAGPCSIETEDAGKGSRCKSAERRRIQAQNLSLLVPGLGGRRLKAVFEG